MLHPTDNCKTFLQYAEGVFIPFILNSPPSSVKRIDIVWDRYFENSLKLGTRKNRGTGVRCKVTTNGVLPSNWVTFLRCSENKKEFFPFLSQNTSKVETDKLIITTVNEK